MSDPNLTQKVFETSETREVNEIYSRYLRFENAIDSV